MTRCKPFASTFNGRITSLEDRPYVAVEFRFDPKFPVSFIVVFDDQSDPVAWEVSRELVSEAMERSCAGLGDLGLSTRSANDFVFDMRVGNRYAQVTVDRSLVEAFFVASERMVPATREWAWLESWAQEASEYLMAGAA